MENRLSAFEVNPIIAAVKNEEQLETAIHTDCSIIFFFIWKHMQHI